MELFTAGQHLSQEALRALLAGELDAEQALQVADHVASCAICAQRLAEAAQTPAHMRAAPRGINEQIRFRLLTSARIRRREFLRYCACAVAGMAAIITLMITAPLPGGALPVARLSETSLPEPALSEFPAPQKLELPKPNRLAEEDQIDDASQEEPDGLFSQIDRYLKSMLGN